MLRKNRTLTKPGNRKKILEINMVAKIFFKIIEVLGR